MSRYTAWMKAQPQDDTVFEQQMAERISAALARQPRIDVPAEFAARVMAALPAAPVRRKRLRFSYGVALALIACALAAAFWLAPHSVASFSNLPFDAEILLTAEVAVIGWLLALRWRES